jgi:hypothetical protein
MRPLTAVVATTLLVATPASAAEVTDCDYAFEDVIEALDMTGMPLRIVPQGAIGPVVTRAETFTGSRYGKVIGAAIVTERDGEIVVLEDIGGCVTQIEIPNP